MSNPVEEAVAALAAAGFVLDGQTRTEHVRIATVRSPVFGGVGGEARTFGGRVRFAKPDTNIKATVGKRTVCFYRVTGGVAFGWESVSTKDLGLLKAKAAAS